MSGISSLFKTIVELHIHSDGRLKQRHFDASGISRYAALVTDDVMEAKREKNAHCSRVYHDKVDVAVVETPMEIKQKIEEAEDKILERIKKSRMNIFAEIAKPIIVLHRKDNGKLLQRHFDASDIYRYSAEYYDDVIDEKRAGNFYCSDVYYGSGKSFTVIETPEEIRLKIEEAEDSILKRMQKAQLSIR